MEKVAAPGPTWVGRMPVRCDMGAAGACPCLNGAGKATAIRCLLGLVRPSAGRCRLLQADVGTSLARVIRQVGSIVETPTLYPRFTGRRNLELLGRLQGIGPKAVAEVLERGGRTDRAAPRGTAYC